MVYLIVIVAFFVKFTYQESGGGECTEDSDCNIGYCSNYYWDEEPYTCECSDGATGAYCDECPPFKKKSSVYVACERDGGAIAGLVLGVIFGWTVGVPLLFCLFMLVVCYIPAILIVLSSLCVGPIISTMVGSKAPSRKADIVSHNGALGTLSFVWAVLLMILILIVLLVLFSPFIFLISLVPTQGLAIVPTPIFVILVEIVALIIATLFCFFLGCIPTFYASFKFRQITGLMKKEQEITITHTHHVSGTTNNNQSSSSDDELEDQSDFKDFNENDNTNPDFHSPDPTSPDETDYVQPTANSTDHKSYGGVDGFQIPSDPSAPDLGTPGNNNIGMMPVNMGNLGNQPPIDFHGGGFGDGNQGGVGNNSVMGFQMGNNDEHGVY